MRPLRPQFPLSAVLAAGIFAAALATPEALARAPLALRLPSQGTAGAAIAYSYAAPGVRRGDQLVIQRQEGTAGSWRTVVKLARSASGSGHLPALPLGIYKLRIADIASHARVVSTAQARISVFGRVPYSTLLPTNGDYFNGTYTLPTHTFSYVDRVGASAASTRSVNAANNDCRAVHLDFAYGNFGNSPGVVGTLTLTQEAADPVAVSAPSESIGALDAALVPGQSWSISATYPAGTVFFLNGYGSCTSTASLVGNL